MTPPKRLAIALTFLLIVFAAPAARSEIQDAQAVIDQIISNVRVAEANGCAVVSVRFNFPVRYVSHFPTTSGKELRVRIRPTNISDDDASFLSRREALRPPKNERAAIYKITYEGDTGADPTLTFYFRSKVAFRIAQGKDYRSIVVAIPGPTPSTDCMPIYPPLK